MRAIETARIAGRSLRGRVVVVMGVGGVDLGALGVDGVDVGVIGVVLVVVVRGRKARGFGGCDEGGEKGEGIGEAEV